MRTTNKLLLLTLFLFVINANGQDPVVQPQGNYGLTSALDGAPPMPGLYYMGYASYYSGTLRDFNGDEISPLPGKEIKLNSALLVNQAVWITNKEVLGGNLFFDFLLPTVHLSLPNYDEAPVDLLGKNSILADISVGLGVQWFNKKLFGLKIFSPT